MVISKFDVLIDFAIKSEKEAVKFYEIASTGKQFAAQKILLRNLAKMEKEHVELLENLKKDPERITDDIRPILDIDISDSRIPSIPIENMLYKDVLLMAMEKEKAAYEFYLNLASKLPDGSSKELLNSIAAEELNHKMQFEELYAEDV